MRLFILILAGILLKSNCTSDVIDSIRLESRTRGYQESIEVKKDLRLIHVRIAPQESNNDTIFISSLKWTELVELASQIPIADIPKLEAPSNEVRLDRVLSQTLEIRFQSGNSILSAHYDKGNPPQGLFPLVTKIQMLVDEG